MKKGNQSGPGSSLQKVCTISEIIAIINSRDMWTEKIPILLSSAQSVILKYSCYCDFRMELAQGIHHQECLFCSLVHGLEGVVTINTSHEHEVKFLKDGIPTFHHSGGRPNEQKIRNLKGI